MSADSVRILIVDDDQDALVALERILEGEGYRTVVAWGGREALAHAEKEKFDLLLINEHVSDLEVSELFDHLQGQQPHAFRFLMRSRRDRKAQPGFVIDSDVCKWEHSEVKARIRSYLG